MASVTNAVRAITVGAGIAGMMSGYGHAARHGIPKKRRTGRRRYKYGKLSKKDTLDEKQSKMIRSLEIAQKNSEATIYRRRRASKAVITASYNNCKYDFLDGCTKDILATALSTLKYFNPSSPATLITVDYLVGTFQKELLCKSKSRLEVANNYRVPVLVEIFLCKVRSDTNQSPISALSAGFADIGALNVIDILSEAKDSAILTDLYSVKRKKKLVLYPGQEISCYHYGKQFGYNTSLVSTHNLQYVKQFKSYSWLVRVSGLVMHGSASTSVGNSQAGVDIVENNEILIIYDGGSDITEVQTSSTTPSVTTPIQSLIDNTQIAYLA